MSDDNSIAVDQTTNDTTVASQPEATPATPTSTPQSQPTETTTEANPTGNNPEQDQSQDADASADGLLDVKDEDASGEKAEGEEKKEAEKPSQLGAPEEGYKFEGMDPSNVALKAFTDAAKELDLSQDSANLVMSKSLGGIQQYMSHQRAELSKQSMMSDALGLKDATTRTQIQNFYSRYFGKYPELRAKIKSVNLDVDPQFLGVLKHMSAEMSEGSFVNGQRGEGSQEDDFRRMFPNTKMNR